MFCQLFSTLNFSKALLISYNYFSMVISEWFLFISGSCDCERAFWSSRCIFLSQVEMLSFIPLKMVCMSGISALIYLLAEQTIRKHQLWERTPWQSWITRIWVFLLCFFFFLASVYTLSLYSLAEDDLSWLNS